MSDLLEHLFLVESLPGGALVIVAKLATLIGGIN
jgi:hypothetical protein